MNIQITNLNPSNTNLPSTTQYERSDFECIVKQLRMVLYKPNCDSNDCELSWASHILKLTLRCSLRWLVRVTHQGPLCWVLTGWLWLEVLTDSSWSQQLGCMCESNTQSIVHLTSKRGAVTCNIHCVIFYLRFSGGKTCNSQSKESHNRNPTYGILYVHVCTH